MSDPSLRATNPFPDLLLVVLTLCNVIALAPTALFALFVLAVVIGWSGFASEPSWFALMVIVAPILHAAGPLLAWQNRGWRFDLRVICLTAPLGYLILLVAQGGFLA